MLQRPFGSTGIQVSALGFGGMRFRNPDDIEGSAALVHHAWERGITYFDTAIGYGRSEEILGTAFKEMAKRRTERPFWISSKTFAGSYDEVRRDCETSLKRLQLDRIDFYHVWCLLSPAAWAERKAKGVLEAFRRLHDEGLIGHICVSSHMAGDDIASVLAEFPFASVLLGYSAANFAYRERALDAATALGRGVVVMNPLAGGVIPQHPERFAFVRTRDDETVVQGALRFLFNDPRISVVLVGAADQRELDEAVDAAEGFRPIPAERIAAMRSASRQAFDQLCTGCRYCEPCPEGVPIPKLMDAYNQQLLSGREQDAADRLKWHWGLLKDGNRLDVCTRCGACEAACTQHLPITERLASLRTTVARATAPA